MSYNLGVDFFVRYNDLDPAAQNQCIFFTKQGRRCRWFCRDNNQAIELHRRITQSENVLMDDIIEYILCNCCRESRAQHRDRIVNIGLLIPLAKRWLDEILTQRQLEEAQGQAAEPSTPTTSAPTLWASSPASSTYATSTTPTPIRNTTIETPLTNPSYYRPGSQSSTPSKPESSPTPAPRTSLIISNTTQVGIQPSGSETRYNLRSREVNFSTTPVSRLTALYSQASLSEFQPHIQKPSPEDAVSWKICESLCKRDFETGSVYIFNRVSSPGHVKIGWTAVSVEARLEGWSKCGYIPNKLFSVDDVPNAQRAETLTHHELIKEWRRERRCKAEHCQVSHQEWFEVSQDKAIQVLDNWATFFKKANPYEWNGSLKTEWKEVVGMLVANGETVTSMKLLEHYEASIKKKAEVKKEPVEVETKSKIEEQGWVPGEPKYKEPVSYEEISDRLLSIHTELEALSKSKLQLKSEALRSQIPMAGVSPLQADKQSKTDPQVNARPLLKTDLLSKAPSKGPFVFSAGSSSKVEQSSSDGPLSVKEPLAKAQSLIKTELLLNGDSQSKATQSPGSKLPNNNRVPSETPHIFNSESASKVQPFSFSRPLFTKQASLTKEPLFTKELPVNKEQLFGAQSLFQWYSSLDYKVSFGTEAQSKTPFILGAKPPSKVEQSSSTFQPSTKEPLFKTQSLFKTDMLSKSEPLPKSDSLPKTPFDTSAFPKTDFVYEVASSKSERLPKTASSSFQSLFKTRLVLENQTLPEDETPRGKATSSPSKDASVDEELLPEQIPLPPSPSLEAADGDQDTSVPWGTDISDALVNLYLDEQVESLDSLTTSVTEYQLEDEGVKPNNEDEVKPQSEHVKQIVQTHHRELKSQEDDETTIVEQEAESSMVEWVEEETLVDTQAPLGLEMAALKIIDKIANVASPEVATKAENGLDGVKVMEREVSPDVDIVAFS
ncbi:hypothetical protein CC78DRAFT_549381 [Lojkania enalia]|uniref:Bacteriophage T5 Orf172 DNA-binding domain-containing protein n=1 Tax=Lojkania enalia TaxID=147567 RepID=A0A9P4MUR0_9PLEO|nr:hypothetical protein CC78DRAFT_549381 [Didymosphaeria enalia]